MATSRPGNSINISNSSFRCRKRYLRFTDERIALSVDLDV